MKILITILFILIGLQNTHAYTQMGLGDHVTSVGTGTPTVSSCGAGTVASGSTDVAGMATLTGVTACEINFIVQWRLPPFCVVQSNPTIAAMAISVTEGQIGIAGAPSGGTITWICIGKFGG